MHWTQAAYLGLLIAACWHGRPHPLLALVLWGNLALTMAMAADPLTVGVVDAVSAAVLLLGDKRCRVVAMLYSVMLPVYVSASWLLWPHSSTYAIIDCIALLQLGVAGGLDRGIRAVHRAIAGRYHRALGIEENGGHATIGVARVSASDRGAVN